jgi:hypothetical protein
MPQSPTDTRQRRWLCCRAARRSRAVWLRSRVHSTTPTSGASPGEQPHGLAENHRLQQAPHLYRSAAAGTFHFWPLRPSRSRAATYDERRARLGSLQSIDVILQYRLIGRLWSPAAWRTMR